MSTASSIAWAARRRAASSLPAPISRDSAEVAPMLMPITMLTVSEITGNVKLIAASSRVPSRPTK